MRKDFQGWMKQKQSIHERGDRPVSYKERQVWWMNIGVNIGSEEDGKGLFSSRPVLVVRGFSKELFWGVALSTTKNRSQYHYAFQPGSQVSVALLSQLRLYDTLRLRKKIGTIDRRDFNGIITKLKAFLAYK